MKSNIAKYLTLVLLTSCVSVNEAPSSAGVAGEADVGGTGGAASIGGSNSAGAADASAPSGGTDDTIAGSGGNEVAAAAGMAEGGSESGGTTAGTGGTPSSAGNAGTSSNGGSAGAAPKACKAQSDWVCGGITSNGLPASHQVECPEYGTEPPKYLLRDANNKIINICELNSFGFFFTGDHVGTTDTWCCIYSLPKN